MKVLVIDDSSLFRRGICTVVKQIPGFEVVGNAPDGQVGLQIARDRQPDLVTVDLEMPVMDGISFITALRKEGIGARVLVFSSHTRSGAKMTIDALLAGANDFLSKTDIGKGSGDPVENMREVLEPKLLQFSQQKVASPPSVTHHPAVSTPSHSPGHLPPTSTTKPSVIAIASSTGGPEALREVLTHLPLLDVPILVAQHMPALFTAELAGMLDRSSAWEIREAVNGEVPVAGKCYIAPGDFHMRVRSLSGKTCLVMDQGPKVNYVRPAADLLFQSMADVYRERVLTVVLTGMGEDGAKGVEKLKSYGCPVLIQDRESSVVWGMPGAVHQTGMYDKVLPLQQVAPTISEHFVSAGFYLAKAVM